LQQPDLVYFITKCKPHYHPALIFATMCIVKSAIFNLNNYMIFVQTTPPTLMAFKVNGICIIVKKKV